MTVGPRQGEQDYPRATTHQFKSDIAGYIRALERGLHKGIVVQRYGEPVAMLIPLAEEQRAILRREAQREKEREAALQKRLKKLSKRDDQKGGKSYKNIGVEFYIGGQD